MEEPAVLGFELVFWTVGRLAASQPLGKLPRMGGGDALTGRRVRGGLTSWTRELWSSGQN